MPNKVHQVKAFEEFVMNAERWQKIEDIFQSALEREGGDHLPRR